LSLSAQELETLHAPALRAGASVVQGDISFISSILGTPCKSGSVQKGGLK